MEIKVNHIELGELNILIDEDDYENLENKNIEVMRSDRNKSGNKIKLYAITYHNEKHPTKVFTYFKYRTYIHRSIMGNPEGMIVDHINGNSLDNRKCNLRICTKKENCQNKIKKCLTECDVADYSLHNLDRGNQLNIRISRPRVYTLSRCAGFFIWRGR